MITGGPAGTTPRVGGNIVPGSVFRSLFVHAITDNHNLYHYPQLHCYCPHA